MKRLSLVLVFALSLTAQGPKIPAGNAGVVAVASDPTNGACVAPVAIYNGGLYPCSGGVHVALAAPAAAGVSTFKGRTGGVVPTSGDYTDALVSNTSAITGATVKAALDAIATALAAKLEAADVAAKADTSTLGATDGTPGVRTALIYNADGTTRSWRQLTSADVFGTTAIGNGGTGGTTAATARTNLGVPATTRAINTATGLTGGGDLSADRTVGLAINGLTEDTTPDADNDYVLTWDASAAAHKKVKPGNLPGSLPTGTNGQFLHRTGGVWTASSIVGGVDGAFDWTNPLAPEFDETSLLSQALEWTGQQSFAMPPILSHAATPSAPAAGKVKVYAKSDNKLYLQTSGGTETALATVTKVKLPVNLPPATGNSSSAFDYASGWTAPAANAAVASALNVGSGGEQMRKAGLRFQGATANQNALFSFRLPPNWDGAQPTVYATMMMGATINAANVKWLHDGFCSRNAVNPATQTYTTGSPVTLTASGTASVQREFTLTLPTTAASCVAGDIYYGRLTRDISVSSNDSNNAFISEFSIYPLVTLE